MATKTIGLALGGGGARGLAHLGALSYLNEKGIRFDVVAGTSVGALVGAFYAANNLERLCEEAPKIKLRDIPALLSPSWSLSGMFSGKNAFQWLEELLEVDTIEELQLPFAATTVDLNSGNLIVKDSGDLFNAIRSSIAIPAIFTPVVENDKVLVDGGVFEPLPVEAARNLGADVVVAIDLFHQPGYPSVKRRLEKLMERNKPFQTTLSYVSELRSKLPGLSNASSEGATSARTPYALEVAEQTLVVSQQRMTRLRLADCPADFIIRPDVEQIGMLDFHIGEEGIALGRAAAETVLPELEKLLESAR